MFFSTNSIVQAIRNLGNVHSFFGITFLACKINKLPVGEEIDCSVDSYTRDFMNAIHKIHPDSAYYYQPYQSNMKDKDWVVKKYPSSSLQRINTGPEFRDAFLHVPASKTWGWQTNYVDYLENRLSRGQKMLIIDLAIWVFKNKNWDEGTDLKKIIEHFISHFNITGHEREKLFSDSVDHVILAELFQKEKVVWDDLRPYLTSPTDAAPSFDATLSYLELSNVGPASRLCMEPASRLNIISGDNGLGKTFLMDCAWWALTEIWPEKSVYPKNHLTQSKAAIVYELSSRKVRSTKEEFFYDDVQRMWQKQEQIHSIPSIPGLIVYARVDGSYAIWDAEKQHLRKDIHTKKQYFRNDNPKKLVFTRDEVWDGKPKNIEGLIRDWVTWQSTPTKYPFGILSRVLERLSPPDLGKLQSGQPVRMRDDTREIPTIVHPYGEIPIVHVSAGVKRIITLAYLIVWAWYEHNVNTSLRGIEPANHLLVFVDEIEAHLHPKWQRVILPALLDVQKLLSNELGMQFIISTHSPLVLASAEVVFNDETDKLFHLDQDTKMREAKLSETEFIKYGLVNSWLTSPIFNLKHARSQEAEDAIEKAKRLQLDENPCAESVKSVHSDLCRYLAETDPFWPRWIFFAENRGGVEI